MGAYTAIACAGVGVMHGVILARRLHPFSKENMTPAIDIDWIGKHCLALFRKIYKLVSESTCPYKNDISLTDVQDELGRFKIWGGNIGAFQPRSMRSSLEHRLQDASQTRQHVLNLLQDLQGSLDESNSICFLQ